MDSNAIEWLALQRLFYNRPKKGLEFLKQRELIKRSLSLEEAKKDLEQMRQLGLDLICINDSRYPKILKEIYDPPLAFFTKGKWPVWRTRPWVAIVGARKATRFGLQKTEEIVKDLVSNEIGIVSGLAYGIDGQAHRVAVENGGVTWGVLGSGLDYLYPKRHRFLAEEMTKKGGYLSEFPLGTEPYPGHFPQRNRIISGLSHAVILVEATLKSGSLITARFALEQGREVFVVPPPKDHIAYEGTRKLLEEGATPFESGEQILEMIQPLLAGNFEKKIESKKPKIIKQESKKNIDHPIIKYLNFPRTLDYLVQKTQKSPGVLLSELMKLESNGYIRKKSGALWQSL